MTAYKDPRQSPPWAKSLQFLHWKMFQTSSGVYIAIFPTILGGLVKVQRPKNLTSQDLKEIEEICLKNKALFIKISPNYDQDIKVLEDAGFEKSYFPLIPPRTMFINLTLSEDELWNRLHHSAKYSINRSVREGDYIEIYRNPSVEKLKEYYVIQKATGKIKHFYVEPFKQLVERSKNFGEDAHLICVYNKDKILEGCKFCLTYDEEALYCTGGTSDEARKTKSGYLLTWEAIKYFKKLGYKNFDLEGMDDPRFPSFTDTWGGFAHFKEKFGGDIIEYPYPYIKSLNEVFKFFSKFSPIGM
jgi:lipid II:glycine glycyltransferase (peptidoglycan interpeptide bridge formation enzyme)